MQLTSVRFLVKYKIRFNDGLGIHFSFYQNVQIDHILFEFQFILDNFVQSPKF